MSRPHPQGLRLIYLVSGPTGCYVGQTGDAAKRKAQHWARASNAPSQSDHRLHKAMRRDGVDRYTFEIIGEARGFFGAVHIENENVIALRKRGVVVFNRFPCAIHLGHSGHLLTLAKLDAELRAAEQRKAG